MKKSLIASLFCLVALFAAGCSSHEGKVMKKFMSSEIVFPSDLLRIEGSQEKHPDLTVPAVRLVIYVDSLQCSTCHLNRMPQYSKYTSLGSLYPDFEVVGIIWPNAENRMSRTALSPSTYSLMRMALLAPPTLQSRRIVTAIVSF